MEKQRGENSISSLPIVMDLLVFVRRKLDGGERERLVMCFLVLPLEVISLNIFICFHKFKD